MEKVFSNTLILSKIFFFLDLKSLKTSREVNELWGHEGGKAMSNFLININPNTLVKRDISAIQTFINLHKSSHALFLSFLHKVYRHNNNPDVLTQIRQDPLFWSQKSDLTLSSEIYKHLTFLAPLISELRLELSLKTQEEAYLLSNLFNHDLKTMKKFALQIIGYDDNMLAAIPIFTLPPATQTFGLNLVPTHHEDVDEESFEEYVIRKSSLLIHLFQSIKSSIKYLDLYSFEKEEQSILLKIISNISKETPDALNLRGLQAWCVLKEDCHIIAEMTQEISILSIFYHKLWNNGIKFADIQAILEAKSESLEVFILTPGNPIHTLEKDEENDVETDVQIKMPYLPKLTTICYGSSVEGITNKKLLDPFNLRNIFLKGPNELKNIMPSLNTLSILFDKGEEEFYGPGSVFLQIFPQEMLQFSQIGTLIISLNCEDCEASEITRFYKIFFNLKNFVHSCSM